MPDLNLQAESIFHDLILDDLNQEERGLFMRVHALNAGCGIMGYLDQHPNEMLTEEDLAFHLREPARALETSLKDLVLLGLLRQIEASGTTFFGLAENPVTRARVRALFNWQRGWHRRLAQIENLVDGNLRQ